MNIAIVSPGMKHDGNTLKKSSLGGSETAAVQLAEAFAKRKDAFGCANRVVVFSPCDAPIIVNNVQYIPIQAAQAFVTGADIDVLIVSRMMEFLAKPHAAKVCFLWCHDLALKRTEQHFRGIIYHIDKILLMSDFQKKQYEEVYNIPEEGIEVIRNGIDPSLFGKYRGPDDRHKGIMVYAARPERGLENLVKPGGIMEKLAKQKPEIKLLVAHYDNTTEQMKQYYEALWARCHELPNVQMLGCLTKDKLYDLYSRSWLYAYPTPSPFMPEFDEISCISAMEAQACGLPFITTSRGALVETVKPGTGTLIPGDGNEEAVQDAFVAEVLSLFDDDERWQKMSQVAFEEGMELSWEPVAQQILTLTDKVLRERSSHPVRLYKHFYRLSDIEMCREMDKWPWSAGDLEATAKEREFIQKGWYFTESPELYRKHYEKVDEGASVSHYDTSENEPRWLVLKEYLHKNKHKIKKVLDYGCWIGHQTIRVANELPDAQVIGVDVTKRNIDLAHECVEKYSIHKNVDFDVWDEMEVQKKQILEGEYDLVLVNEVLEHVLDPQKLIRQTEKWCKQGGSIFITTPYGPWEYMSYFTFPHRCHLRHYEMADLMDVFGKKKNISVFYRNVGHDKEGTPIGHHYVIYENNMEHGTGKVNVERKLGWQAPRETLSTCMITYNAESMLHRCLKSVREISDELIVAIDPKTTDSTKAIAEQYGARIIEGLDPVVNGFYKARNHSIDTAHSDWILWIDSDEELLQPEKLYKYLRPNFLNAYALQQHHLSVDPPINLKPDLPMRLFRNHKGIQFYGVVHEHPEKEYNKGIGYALILSDTWIAHDGYLTEAIRRNRFLRNIDMVIRDRKEFPDRLLGKFLWLRDLIHLCRYRIEGRGNGGPMIDEQIIAWAREAQELYEETYLENPTDPMAQDAINYYSEANRILGKGVPVKFAFMVEGGRPGEIAAQFRNAEIASKFMAAYSKSHLIHFEGRYI